MFRGSGESVDSRNRGRFGEGAGSGIEDGLDALEMLRNGCAFGCQVQGRAPAAGERIIHDPGIDQPVDLVRHPVASGDVGIDVHAGAAWMSVHVQYDGNHMGAFDNPDIG